MKKTKKLKNGWYGAALLFLSGALILSCKDKEYVAPVAKTQLQNDVIKRSIGPNIAGLNMEFAYAMALGPEKGKLVSAKVEATIPGAEGTFLEHRSYYTDGGGQDVGVAVGEPSVTSGNVTTVNFSKDTSAATLRFFYRVPEAAKGQEVSFKFTATASTGETVTYDMGPYHITKMDMRLDIPVQDSVAAFISIGELRVLSQEEAQANPDKIDLVYLYRSIPGITFNHSLISPGANSPYLAATNLPAAAKRISKVRKVWGLRDLHLARAQFGIFIDDPDFEQIDLAGMPDQAINMRAESGAWVETADKSYRAYIYFNSVNNGGKKAVVSVKRYKM
ncbi:hypothetical protein GCM10023091_42250 [Ravibacter arvi]|uniref:DUF4466 domain-containing protein n=1 Tax=Ravibacter arvi TaxID=2051041 RepID=A0ABP8MEM2_9BACT